MSIYNEHNLSRKKLRKECVFASLVNEAPKKQRNKEEADGEKKTRKQNDKKWKLKFALSNKTEDTKPKWMC